MRYGRLQLKLACTLLLLTLTACGKKSGDEPATYGNTDLVGAYTNAAPGGETTTAASAEATGAAEITVENGLVTLGFAGDVNLSEGWETTEKLDASPNGISDCISPDLLEQMRGFDIFMVNNEFTYSTRGEPSEKTYTFRADPSRVDIMKQMGVDIVLTANNHINDYGHDALTDTLDTLDQAGLPYVGAGRNLEEAKRIRYFDVNGRTIAYVAASCAEEHEETIWTSTASDATPGILGVYDPKVYLDVIREAAEHSDYVVASVHWGYEYLEYFSPEQRTLAEQMIAAGADAVIGTHPHVLQGIEYIDGKPVVYSLGNFWFNKEDLMSGIAELTLRIPEDPAAEVTLEKLRFIPCTQYGIYTEEPADASARREILDYMETLSMGLPIADDGTVEGY